MKYRTILASGSPRRKELMNQMGATYTCKTSSKEEIIRSTNPEEVVAELSCMKAEDVAERERGPVLVIGADTVVSYHGEILGKPKGEEDAVRMITSFAGDMHEVYTGVTLLIKESEASVRKISFVETTKVYVYPMTEQEIRDYVATGEPMDKAGAYAIQGKFAPYIKGIEGDYYNIVGFPIAGIYQRLKDEGIEL